MKTIKNYLMISAVLGCIIPATLLAQEKEQGKKMPPPKADIYIVPQAVTLPISLQYPAKLKAYQQVGVYSRVLGVLEEQNFIEGERVNQGDLLFTIEDEIYKAKLDAALATLKMNEATLENAKKDWERIKILFSKKAVTAEKRDAALYAYEKALSGLALAKAGVAQAKVDYEYTRVKAPISGFVGLKKVDVGDLVTQNPPMELVSITSNDKMYLDFSIPMSDFENLQNGTWSMPEDEKISVTLIQDSKELGYKGVVDFIDVNIDKATATVKMRAVVENTKHQLMAGDFVRVKLEGIIQKDVITIPQKALLQNPMGTIVMIEENGVAAVRPIIVGKESGDQYVVAGGALKSGDRVIVNNFFKVKPGQPLQVDKIINQ